MPVPECLTLQEAATLLRIGERTAYTRCRSGQFPGAAKVGSRWRVDRAALESWLRQGGNAPSKLSKREEARG